MSLGFAMAAMMQTVFVVITLIVLMPFTLPRQKFSVFVSLIIIVPCVLSGFLVITCGVDFLPQYGYFLVGLPLYIILYIFSKAKGTRFTFVLMTILIFHLMVSTVLMVVRIYFNGFTFLYFVISFCLFGILVYGAKRIKTDFHKIVFSYQKEFGCLSFLLFLLLILVWTFNPIVNNTQVDNDILMIAILLYATVIMLYLYIGITFRNFSIRLDAERNTTALSQQMQTAQEHIKLMQSTRENATLYHHDLRRHILLIGELLDKGNLAELRSYLLYVQNDIDAMAPQPYCINEAANLLLTSFVAQAQKLGVHLSINAQIPQSLSINSTELCTLLSNALENALTATAAVNDGRVKMIRLNASMSDGKLLLSVENPYSGTVRIENGLPKNKTGSNGFGIKSMESIAKKYDGISMFEAQDGIFIVRLVI